jgi:hypothetical protein
MLDSSASEISLPDTLLALFARPGAFGIGSNVFAIQADASIAGTCILCDSEGLTPVRFQECDDDDDDDGDDDDGDDDDGDDDDDDDDDDEC